MEEFEKMRGLKTAYAEIILNTAKEAAARIMVSEKRVQQVNHDLSYTKDEALRLLLRLKQTMDFKLNEAEMKSRHQQRKIEELEAQLQEAEDIVSNLRAELNEVHIKMEETKKIQMHNRPNMMEEAACKKVIIDDVLATQVKGQSNKTMEDDHTATDSLEENGYVGIVRSNKPEMFVNGCTQRVRAYEGKFFNGHIPIDGELDYIKDGKISRENVDDGEIYKKSLVGSDVAHKVGQELVNVVDVNNVDIFRCPGQISKAVRKKRKFAARRRRSGTSLLKSLPIMDKEGRSDLPNSQNCLPSSHDMLQSHNNEVKGKQSVSPSTSPLNVLEISALSEHVVGAQGDDAVLIREKNGCGDCSDVPNSNPKLEISTNLDGKLQNINEDLPNLRPKDRVVKYTFQRKRKKETLSIDYSSLVPRENPVKRKTGKKQNGSIEQPNSGSGAESSRDSRRMAQVARQLISLSDKKWWK